VGFKSAKRRRPSRAWLGHLEAARRRRSAPGLRVRVRDEADEGARWAFAAGSWLGWERARAGTIAGPSWAILLVGPVVGWAWWVAACGATAAGEGVEGATLDFN
jgi:hypothetical protein